MGFVKYDLWNGVTNCTLCIDEDQMLEQVIRDTEQITMDEEEGSMPIEGTG